MLHLYPNDHSYFQVNKLPIYHARIYLFLKLYGTIPQPHTPCALVHFNTFDRQVLKAMVTLIERQ